MGTVTLEIPRFLKHLAEGASLFSVKGTTVGECLEDFVRQLPSARNLLFDPEGKLLGHIDLFVNGVSAFPEELTRRVQQGDAITMLYLINGG